MSFGMANHRLLWGAPWSAWSAQTSSPVIASRTRMSGWLRANDDWLPASTRRWSSAEKQTGPKCDCLSPEVIWRTLAEHRDFSVARSQTVTDPALLSVGAASETTASSRPVELNKTALSIRSIEAGKERSAVAVRVSHTLTLLWSELTKRE